jgi:ABC-type uncharacterized transport system permease subunit
MGRIRLAGLFLFAIGIAILIGTIIYVIAINSQTNRTIDDLQLIGFAIGISGVSLYRIIKEPKMKQTSQNIPLPS